MVAFMLHKHLGLVLEPPERGGMDDAVSVTLEFCSGRRRGFWQKTAAGAAVIDCEWRERTFPGEQHVWPRSGDIKQGKKGCGLEVLAA
jgi:hypothetical protein